MKTKLLIHTQYYENYNVGPEGFNQYGDKKPHWKPKGEHTFMIETDLDMIFYSDPAALFSILLEKHNTVAERFEYRDYTIQHQEPTLLGTEEDLEKAFQKIESLIPTL